MHMTTPKPQSVQRYAPFVREPHSGLVGGKFDQVPDDVTLLYDVRLLLLPMLLPELAYSTHFRDRFHGRPNQGLALGAP